MKEPSSDSRTGHSGYSATRLLRSRSDAVSIPFVRHLMTSHRAAEHKVSVTYTIDAIQRTASRRELDAFQSEHALRLDFMQRSTDLDMFKRCMITAD